VSGPNNPSIPATAASGSAAGSGSRQPAGATVQSITPDLMPWGTIAFMSVAAAVGAGSGATFALVGKVAPASKVGSVTGLVGAAGGLGGFIPPLVMGYIYGRTDSYGLGLALLVVVAAGTMIFTMTVVRSAVVPRAAEATGPTEPRHAMQPPGTVTL